MPRRAARARRRQRVRGRADRRRRAGGVATGEVVFNTALSGYQEIITDPSYAGQIITFTYPHIGNYGVTAADNESRRAVLPRCRSCASSPAATATTAAEDRPRRASCAGTAIPGIAGIDTRRLTRLLRDTGAMPGAFGTADEADAAGRRRDRAGHRRRRPRRRGDCRRALHRRRRATPDRRLRLRHQDDDPAPALAARPGRGRARRRPRAADVLARRPDGVFLSNGPGDPAMVPYAVEAIGELVGNVPVFGICLGHQLLGRALGGEHVQAAVRPPRRQPPGAQHAHRARSRSPARTTTSRRRRARSPAGAERDPRQPQRRHQRGHARARTCPAFSVQYHPEAGPGPHDTRYLFDRVRDADAARTIERYGAECPGVTTSHSILIIGSGPIVIGQACEFDYSGTQACRVLKDEGYRVVLANSNPATIMTDPDFADATYIEPLDVGGGRRDHRARAARRRAADARRADRAQHGDGAVRAGPDRRAGHAGDDRRQRRGDRHRRGPRASSSRR